MTRGGLALSARIRQSVGAQAIMLSAATAFSQAIVAVIYILAARSSGPTDYGHLVSAIAIGLALSGYLDFGSNSLWVRELATGRTSLSEISARASSKLLISAGLVFLVAPVSALLGSTFLPTIAILATSFVSQCLVVPLRGAGRGDIVAWLSILERTVALVAYLGLTQAGLQAVNALWIALSLGTALVGVAAYLATERNDRYRLRLRGIKSPWRGAKYFGLSAIAGSSQQLDVAILAAIAGPTAAGTYGAVSRWTQPMGILASAFSTASAPFVARAPDWRAAREAILKAAWLLLLAITMCAVLIVFAPQLTILLLGPEYEASGPVLAWLAAATIPAILNQPLSSALQARQYDRPVAIAFVVSVLGQLVLVAVLSQALAELGGAIALFATQLVILLSFSSVLIHAIRSERLHPKTENTA